MLKLYRIVSARIGVLYMDMLIDKLIIFLVCATVYIACVSNAYMIVPILAVVILSAALSWLESDGVSSAVFIVYSIVCFYMPALLFFIPLLCYDAFFNRIKWLSATAFLPLAAGFVQTRSAFSAVVCSLILSSYMLKRRTCSATSIKGDYFRLRDSNREMSLQLQKNNKELIEKQDYEINLATLKERNRIARDIHDNVGHLLSRSILQVGAMLAAIKDEESGKSLSSLNSTLSEAMNSIRTSVHDLYEESVNLKVEMRKLIDNFKFCKIDFAYDVENNPEKDIKYCFLAVAKEALSNIIKHSNATAVSLTVREHPALYQLIIHDNGASEKAESDEGIGLKSIKERVSSVGGYLNISTDRGFRIFISIPKGGNYRGTGEYEDSNRR